MGTVSKRLLGREEQYLVIMKLLLLSLLGCVAVQSAHHEEMKQIVKEIHTYNLRSQCWGEENVLAYGLQKSACSWPQPMTWLSFSSLSTIPSQLFLELSTTTPFKEAFWASVCQEF